MTNLVRIANILMVVFLISGCAPRNLISGAEYVNLVSKPSDLPKSCRYLGEILGRDIHDGTPLSKEDLHTDDVNFLKNEAKKRGANVVMLKQHQITQTQTERRNGKGQPQKVLTESHNIVGEAFLCP